MMKTVTDRICAALCRAEAFLSRRRMIACGAVAFALALLLAVYNISSGPLHNLFDIGGWSNRALLIALAAAVHALVLLLCARLSRAGFARTALRQLIVTAGYYIMLMAMNHKTHAFVGVMLPMIRAMDAGGPAAGFGMGGNLSAPMTLLVYLITRGPVYDMYMLKVFAIGCMMVLSLLITAAAEKHGFGWRTETLLTLCMILPQGYMNAACSALIEIAPVTLLGVSLACMFLAEKRRPAASALAYGAAVSLSGAALYALPVYLFLLRRGGMTARQLACALLVPAVSLLACLLCGMPALQAAASLLAAVLMKPAYACGAPGMMNLIPRADVFEMPHYAPVLRHFESLDLVTHAQEYYTAAHFEQISAGFVLLCLAGYLGLCALASRMENRTALHRVFVFVLSALLFAPGVTSAAWLAADLLCLYAVLRAPRLRLPASLVLFATAASSVYPLAEDVRVPMVYGFVLCGAALCLLLDVIPMPGEKEKNAL